MKGAFFPVCLTALVCLALIATGIDFALDDAWIHLAYAKSLKLGEGLSYNPNDYETGASSPLWVLLLASIPWFGHPVLVSKMLGLLCHLGSIGVLLSLLRHWFPHLNSSSFTGLCAGLAPLSVQSSVSGMAVCLATLLWLGALLAVMAGADGPWFWSSSVWQLGLDGCLWAVWGTVSCGKVDSLSRCRWWLLRAVLCSFG